MKCLSLALLISVMCLNVGSLPKAEEMHERVRKRHDALYNHKLDGSRQPLVCVVCDKFLIHEDERLHVSVEKLSAAGESLRWTNFEDARRKPDIERHFAVDNDILARHPDLKGLALSPRSPYFKKARGRKWGFSCCKRCHSNVMKKEATTPRHATVNSNCIGATPRALSALNEAELAFLTSVEGHGFCFAFTGGKQKCLKGTLPFMKVDEQTVAKAVGALEAMDLNENAVTLHSGELTAWQKERARELCSVRPKKLIEALNWPKENNPNWADVDEDKIVRETKDKDCQPRFIDKAETVEGENSNIEKQHMLTCHCPDGALDTTHGGLETPDDFKKWVSELASEGHTVELKADIRRRFANESDGDPLVEGNLLQFPCGIGGENDSRSLNDGTRTAKSDLNECLQQLSLQSQEQFQRPLFQLMLCSLMSKNQLLKSSRLQLRGETDAHGLACGLNQKDALSGTRGRRMGNRFAGTNVSEMSLNAVDATAKDLPHANEAAKKARGKGEAMQHHFGMGSVFLACAFDDENSLLMTALAGKDNDERTTDELNDHEVTEKAKLRREIRLEHPGLAALNFEMPLEILMEEVIGWDCKNNKPKTRKVGKNTARVKGHFGDVFALSCATEEQGRKTLHVHVTLWTEGFKETQFQYFFGNAGEKKAAMQVIQKHSEHAASAALFPENSEEAVKAFNHQCKVPIKKRQPPAVANDQSLRHLRNRRACKETGGVVSVCDHCDEQWTYEEMMIDFLKNSEGICQVVNPEENEMVMPKARMFSKVLDFQKGKMEVPRSCTNASCQHHSSCHLKPCFRCQKGRKRRHVCGEGCECRHRSPDKKRRRAEMFANDDSIDWFSWNGSVTDQPLAQVAPKRRKHDVFQNSSCPAMSHSAFSCNNNVSLILDGPIGQCQHECQEKQTQDDDVGDCKEVEASTKKFNGERAHENDRREAPRRMCRAAFAHDKKNAISPCFASHLTRNNTRFYYSHDFKCCPLRDLTSAHNKEGIGAMVKHASNGAEEFFENFALDCLCRHEDLEDLSPADFTEQYCTACVPSDWKKKDILPCQPHTGHCAHPSVLKSGERKGECARGAKERDEQERVRFRVGQWMFPDTAQFGDNTFTCDRSKFNNSVEGCAQPVLTLFVPHRCSSDLRLDGSCPHLSKLRAVFEDERSLEQSEKVVFSERNMEILQNTQNCRSNTLRCKMNDDPLTSVTQPYSPKNEGVSTEDKDPDEEEVEVLPHEEFLDFMAEGEMDSTVNDPTYSRPKLNGFTFKHMRNLGQDQCGCDKKVGAADGEACTKNIVSPAQGSSSGTAQQNNDDSDEDSDQSKDRKCYTCDQVVSLQLSQSVRHTKVLWENEKEKKVIDVGDATGSVKSVIEWSKAAFQGDAKQQRAFEVLTSAFVLTFFEETDEMKTDPTQTLRRKRRQAERGLRSLGGIKSEYNLVCPLHGPGGSGKSTVLNAAQAYAADHCKKMSHPHTTRTMIATAMSGVAAALTNGETTHSVLGLNKKKEVTAAETDEFFDARSLIIDECSFASGPDFEKMHVRLKGLMKNKFNKFGGVNIVFCGDFSQLEPVNRDPVCKDGERCPEFQGCLNSYIELDGRWRFVNDPAFGDAMFNMRDKGLTEDEIDCINTRVTRNNDPELTPPPGIQIASYTNADRDAINSAVYDDYTTKNRPEDGSTLLSACVIFMDDTHMNDSKKRYAAVTSNNVLKYFYEHCTEDQCSHGKSNDSGGRVDPALKPCGGCPMMLTRNSDVSGGEANGSRVAVKTIRMKMGEHPFDLQLSNGTTIQAAFASQVAGITVEHECSTIQPREFEVVPEDFHFVTKIHDKHDCYDDDMFVKMKGTQFPIISGSCATGHKLQGCSVDEILINNWHYGANWAYVVLSRVRSLRGLYLRKPLSYDVKRHTPDPHMKAMLEDLQRRVGVDMLTDEDYTALEQENYAALEKKINML